jgi:hypothetical protein
MMKKFGSETSAKASTWPIQPINMIKKFGQQTSPTTPTWPVQPMYMMKEVGPDTSSRVSTWSYGSSHLQQVFWPTPQIHYPHSCRRSGFSHGPRRNIPEVSNVDRKRRPSALSTPIPRLDTSYIYIYKACKF